MFTPVFERESCQYILLDRRYFFETNQEALAYGLVGQIFLSDYDYLFKGKSKYVTDSTEFVLIKDTSPLTNETIEMALIEGEDFENIKSGVRNSSFVSLSEKLLNDNVFILDIIYMNEETNFTIATALEKDTYEPYVIFTRGDTTDAVTTDVAYEISSMISHAASAAWNDSYLMKALNEVFDDDELSQTKKEQLLDSIRQLREERRLLEYEKRQTAEEETAEEGNSDQEEEQPQ